MQAGSDWSRWSDLLSSTWWSSAFIDQLKTPISAMPEPPDIPAGRGRSPHAAPRWRPGPPQTDDRPVAEPGQVRTPRPPAVRRDQLHGAESKRACRWCSRPVAAANRSSAAKGRGQAQREPQRVAVESLNNQPILGQRDRDQRRALSTVWWSTPKCFAIALTRTPRSHIAAARVAIDW